MRTAVEVAIASGLPVALRGRPGVGKTSMVESIAHSHGLHLEVVVGSLHEPTDIAGLPVVGSDGTVTLAPPRWAVRAAEAPTGAVVMLDELTTASPAVQAAMLRVVRERIVGDLAMGPSVRIVAAYNDARDCGGYELELPMRSRLLHIDVRADLEAFLTGVTSGWGQVRREMSREATVARTASVSTMVAGYLKARPTMLEVPPNPEDSGGYPCPRTWEMTIDAMSAARAWGASDEVVSILVSGCIGPGAASEFLSWKEALDLPDPHMILANPAALGKVLDKRRPDFNFVVISEVIGAARSVGTRDAWLALADVLGADVTCGCGDVVVALARDVTAWRPADTKVPDSFRKVMELLG